MQPMESQIPSLHDVLHGLDPTQVRSMRAALRCASQVGRLTRLRVSARMGTHGQHAPQSVLLLQRQAASWQGRLLTAPPPPCPAAAPQHFLYSSITGGFMQESGKYDAFETMLEVLRWAEMRGGEGEVAGAAKRASACRMRVTQAPHVPGPRAHPARPRRRPWRARRVKGKYPDAFAMEYADIDADFRRFMYCGHDDYDGGGRGAMGRGDRAADVRVCVPSPSSVALSQSPP